MDAIRGLSIVLFAISGLIACNEPETTELKKADDEVFEAGCGDITFDGKCKGNVLKYCQDEKLEKIDCSQINATCGWDETYEYNTCLLPTAGYQQEELSSACADRGVTKCVYGSEIDVQECVEEDSILKWRIYPCNDENSCTKDWCENDVCQFEYSCAEGTYCNGAVCEPVCVPNCLNKNCGLDGCGGNCGSCPGDNNSKNAVKCNLTIGQCQYQCGNGLWCLENEKCCQNKCIPEAGTCCKIKDKPDISVWCPEKYPNCVTVPADCEADYNTKCCPADLTAPDEADPCNKCSW